MTLHLKARLTLLSLACAISFGAAARDNESNKVSPDLAKEIRTFFADQDQANRNGLTTTELASRFYAEDAVITGEGEAMPRRGVKGASVALDEWLAYLGPGGNKGCSFAVQDPIVSSGNMVSVFAVLSCKPNPPKTNKQETIRQLFVLKRTSQGWRVVQEMWQAGTFGK